MKPFTYERARTPAEAAAAAARVNGAKFVAGGTNLLDLMKLQIETPAHLIDVNGLALDKRTVSTGTRVVTKVARLFAPPMPARARLRQNFSEETLTGWLLPAPSFARDLADKKIRFLNRCFPWT